MYTLKLGYIQEFSENLPVEPKIDDKKSKKKDAWINNKAYFTGPSKLNALVIAPHGHFTTGRVTTRRDLLYNYGVMGESSEMYESIDIEIQNQVQI